MEAQGLVRKRDGEERRPPLPAPFVWVGAERVWGHEGLGLVLSPAAQVLRGAGLTACCLLQSHLPSCCFLYLDTMLLPEPLS